MRDIPDSPVNIRGKLLKGITLAMDRLEFRVKPDILGSEFDNRPVVVREIPRVAVPDNLEMPCGRTHEVAEPNMLNIDAFKLHALNGYVIPFNRKQCVVCVKISHHSPRPV
jgi:hypothetical protein